MSRIGDIRWAMAHAIDGRIGERVQVLPYMKANPTPPTIQIIPPSTTYDYAMQRGLDEWLFTIQAVVALTDDQAAQEILDDLCEPGGTTSIKAALEADTTLGGACERLRVLGHSAGIAVIRQEGNPMLLVEFQVQVFARGN